jgi:hypothetical protein
MARSGLSDNRILLRQMTEVGTADYTVAGIAYWSDIQLDEILDRYRTDLVFFELTPNPSYANGDTLYLEYRSGYADMESTTGGTSVFYVQDSAGNTQGTALYTPDYARGIVTFAADTGGTTYFLTARSYDLRGAASEVWLRKSGFSGFSVEYQNHCLKMAEVFRAGAKISTVTIDMRRDDTDG